MSMPKIYITEHAIEIPSSEMRKLERIGSIKVYTPTNTKHKFFHDIKLAPYKSYQGGWGNEHIKWDGHNSGVLRCTEDRVKEIQQYILKDLHSNNE